MTNWPGPGWSPGEPAEPAPITTRSNRPAPFPGRPSDLLEPALAASAQAWEGVPATAEQVATPLPAGQPARPEYAVAACAMDAAVHAWDIARGTEQPAPFNDELAVALMPAAHTSWPSRCVTTASLPPVVASEGPVRDPHRTPTALSRPGPELGRAGRGRSRPKRPSGNN